MSDFTLAIPNQFSFKRYDLYNFDRVLGVFDWKKKDGDVVIDFRGCSTANYQALALVVLYLWQVRCNGCRIQTLIDDLPDSASHMWKAMGAQGWSQVLNSERQNFLVLGREFKPLWAVRNKNDFDIALSKVDAFTKQFDIEYEKTLRYVVSELLYNTLEHGKCYYDVNGTTRSIPSLIQFSWYKQRNELCFLVADLGVGIKKHLEQTYPAFADHRSAIEHSLRPKVSGTFGVHDPYKGKDNAGVGLFFSSNIIRRLRADMYLISGDGLVHVSPVDVTSKTLDSSWPGTMVLVVMRLGPKADYLFHDLLSELREAARQEMNGGHEDPTRYVVHMANYFGSYAENKEEAIRFRDRRLLPAISEGKSLTLDFTGVISSPHSFLNALLATPILRMGMQAYRKIRIQNADPAIRETIDYILEDNTRE